MLFGIPWSAVAAKIRPASLMRISRAPWYHLLVNVAISLPGAITIFTSSLVLAVGAGAGLASLAWRAGDDAKITHLNSGIWALVGSLVGGRALYVVLHWSYFQNNLAEVIQVYRGGLAWAGALIGAIVAMLFLSRISQRPFGELADMLIPLVFAISVSAWLGCWLTGCAYGLPTQAWWALPAMDEWGVIAARVPVQLLAILLTSILFWLVSIRRKHTHTPGQTAGLFFIGVSFIYFLSTYLRADPVPVWAGLRWDAWAALSFSIAGLAYSFKLNQTSL